MEENKSIDEITASEYFQMVKAKKQEITLDVLKACFDNMALLAQKYNKTGQIDNLKKLHFLTSILSKEEAVIKMGINKFIYRDDIIEFTDNVTKHAVKIIEAKNYVREIPDEVVEIMEKTREIFSNFYILYTDYTGTEERRVEKKKREKDPILFGVFQNGSPRSIDYCISDRFYVLGEWVDEYCDLTLDKMIAMMDKNPVHEIEIPQSQEELLVLLNEYTKKETSSNDETPNFVLVQEISDIPLKARAAQKKIGIFDKIRSFLHVK